MRDTNMILEALVRAVDRNTKATLILAGVGMATNPQRDWHLLVNDMANIEYEIARDA